MKKDAAASILIADDNPQNLQVLGQIIQETGYNVSVAKNGKDVMAYVKKATPDLILLDMMMPEMDGLETCEALKSEDKTHDIPVIFITALTDEWNKLKAFETGGVDYITKPFMKEEVVARINVHIRLRTAMKKLQAMSVTDEMTGAYNRRFAYHILSKQMKLSKRENLPFIVGYVDIDNLKTINDLYGHDLGDQLIQKVVDSIQMEIRESDYVFRMGGDEFLILFPKAKVDEADNVVSRIKTKLKGQNIADVPVEFCCGFSEYHPDEDISIDELIKKADGCMYEEKKGKKK